MSLGSVTGVAGLESLDPLVKNFVADVLRLDLTDGNDHWWHVEPSPLESNNYPEAKITGTDHAVLIVRILPSLLAADGRPPEVMERYTLFRRFSMFKHAFMALIVTFATQTSFADVENPIFKKVYKDSDDTKIAALVIQTYKAALKSSTKNKIQTEVAGLSKELEDSGTVYEPDESSMFRLSSGKGSATSYGFIYLLGVPVSMKGTGLIEEYGRYIQASVYLDMAKNKITVTLDDVLNVTPKK